MLKHTRVLNDEPNKCRILSFTAQTSQLQLWHCVCLCACAHVYVCPWCPFVCVFPSCSVMNEIISAQVSWRSLWSALSPQDGKIQGLHQTHTHMKNSENAEYCFLIFSREWTSTNAVILFLLNLQHIQGCHRWPVTSSYHPFDLELG